MSNLVYTALIHDIGKLIVPSEVIDKEGPLTKEEYELVKKHSLYSEEVLKDVDGFEEVASWLGQHHERLDGKGYPYQLKGDEITKQARIVQMADVFSAISEHRPYRASMDNDEVLRKLNDMCQLNQLDHSLYLLLEKNVEQLRPLIDVRLKQDIEKKNTFYLDN